MSSFVDISSTMWFASFCGSFSGCCGIDPDGGRTSIWKSETYTGGFGPAVGVCGRPRRAFASPTDQLALKRMAPINTRRANVFIQCRLPVAPTVPEYRKAHAADMPKIKGCHRKDGTPEISSSEIVELVRLTRSAHGHGQRGLLNGEHVRARLVPFPKRQTLASKHTPDASRIPPQDFFKHRNEHAHGVVAQHRPPSYLGYVHRLGNSDSQSIVMINVHHHRQIRAAVAHVDDLVVADA